jgi:hypothetical protein
MDRSAPTFWASAQLDRDGQVMSYIVYRQVGDVIGRVCTSEVDEVESLCASLASHHEGAHVEIDEGPQHP